MKLPLKNQKFYEPEAHQPLAEKMSDIFHLHLVYSETITYEHL